MNARLPNGENVKLRNRADSHIKIDGIRYSERDLLLNRELRRKLFVRELIKGNVNRECKGKDFIVIPTKMKIVN